MFVVTKILAPNFWICPIAMQQKNTHTVFYYSYVHTPFSAADRTLVGDSHYGCLCEQLRPCAASWEDIAKYLGFKAHEVANIRADPLKQVNAPGAFMDSTVDRWSHWAPGDSRGSKDYATLEALITAVDRAGFAVIAQKLTLQ